MMAHLGHDALPHSEMIPTLPAEEDGFSGEVDAERAAHWAKVG